MTDTIESLATMWQRQAPEHRATVLRGIKKERDGYIRLAIETPDSESDVDARALIARLRRGADACGVAIRILEALR